MAAANWLVDKAFTATGVDFSTAPSTSWIEVPVEGGEGPAGRSDLGAQALRVFATSDASSGSATVQVVFTEQDESTGAEIVFHSQDGAVTVGARRSAPAGATGTYLCAVAFPITARDTVDLMGLRKRGLGANQTKCYIGCTALTTITSLRVRVCATRNT